MGHVQSRLPRVPVTSRSDDSLVQVRGALDVIRVILINHLDKSSEAQGIREPGFRHSSPRKGCSRSLGGAYGVMVVGSY